MSVGTSVGLKAPASGDAQSVRHSSRTFGEVPRGSRGVGPAQPVTGTSG
jgi:hypothetical protein